MTDEKDISAMLDKAVEQVMKSTQKPDYMWLNKAQLRLYRDTHGVVLRDDLEEALNDSSIPENSTFGVWAGGITKAA